MARHGRCQCGTVLKFRMGPWGYKKRCPHCGAIVRLRSERSAPPPAPAAGAQVVQMEMWPVEEYTPRPPSSYWFWVGITGMVSLVALIALIWFTRR